MINTSITESSRLPHFLFANELLYLFFAQMPLIEIEDFCGASDGDLMLPLEFKDDHLKGTTLNLLGRVPEQTGNVLVDDYLDLVHSFRSPLDVGHPDTDCSARRGRFVRERDRESHRNAVDLRRTVPRTDGGNVTSAATSPVSASIAFSSNA